MTHWLTMADACRLLSVQPQTVYAYVSRGKIDVSADPTDHRRSLYRAEDVQALVRRKQDGRKREAVATNTLFGAEPSIPTAISGFSKGRPHFRGQDAVTLARSATLEEIAQLLWGADRPADFEAVDPRPGNGPVRQRAFVCLATLAASGHSTRGRQTRVLWEEAQGLVGHLACAFGAAVDRPAPLHRRLAAGWSQGEDVADLLRMALALLADHELTSSAFATRIAASTGASLPACLLAGLATFSGPLHGDASGRVQALIEDVERVGVDLVVDRHLTAGLPIAGFGHPMYPDGDPRAAALFERLEPPPILAEFIDRVRSATGLQPTIDVALAALVARFRLPNDAAFTLFALARSVGLLAHAIEQLGMGQVIRPRGRYCGPPPQ